MCHYTSTSFLARITDRQHDEYFLLERIGKIKDNGNFMVYITKYVYTLFVITICVITCFVLYLYRKRREATPRYIQN